MLARQQNGPLAEDRRRYLVHCAEQQMARRLCGISPSTSSSSPRPALADRPGELITPAEIEAEADRWANRRPEPPKMRQIAVRGPISRAMPSDGSPSWGACNYRPQSRGRTPNMSLNSPTHAPGAWPVAPNRRYPCRKSTRSSPRSTRVACASSLTVPQVDEFLAKMVRDGGYARTTVQTWTSTLRAFFRYAEGCGWCRLGLAAAIMAPRVFPHEGPPARALLGRRQPHIRHRPGGSARRHSRSRLADAAGGLRSPRWGSHEPATGRLQLGAGAADRSTQQTAEAADLSAVPSGRGCHPALLAGGAATVSSAGSVPHASGTVPAIGATGWGRWSAAGCTRWT